MYCRRPLVTVHAAAYAFMNDQQVLRTCKTQALDRMAWDAASKLVERSCIHLELSFTRYEVRVARIDAKYIGVDWSVGCVLYREYGGRMVSLA